MCRALLPTLLTSPSQVYNEDIRDLLAPGDEKLSVHEAPEQGVYVAGLKEVSVTGPAQVLQLMEIGETNRHYGSTQMNERSSRSHTILRVNVEVRGPAPCSPSACHSKSLDEV